jgi:hypothetical protein
MMISTHGGLNVAVPIELNSQENQSDHGVVA